MSSLPLPPSAMCRNLSVSSCAGPSDAGLGHALEQPKHSPGWSRTCRFVQLDAGYKPGSGEGCHGAADIHTGQGWMMAEKLICFSRDQGNPWFLMLSQMNKEMYSDLTSDTETGVF